jgi:hypothetical protein
MYSSVLLATCGVILMAVGLYFILLRPALLPEDLRYTHASLREIRAELPGLLVWLPKVYWVLGGYIFTTGFLTLYIALTTFRVAVRRPVAIMVLAGLSSIGGMTVVNVLIDSAFRLPLAGIAALWGAAVVLSWVEDRGREHQFGRLRGTATSGM